MKHSMFAALLFAMLTGLHAEPAAPQEPPAEKLPSAEQEQTESPEPITA